MTMTRRLPVYLSQADQLARSMQMARKRREIADVKRERKVANAEWDATIKRLEDDFEILADAILNGSEEQDVPVEEVRDYPARLVRVMRMDMKDAEVDRRAMTDEEYGDLQVDAFKDVSLEGQDENADASDEDTPPKGGDAANGESSQDKSAETKIESD